MPLHSETSQGLKADYVFVLGNVGFEVLDFNFKLRVKDKLYLTSLYC